MLKDAGGGAASLRSPNDNSKSAEEDKTLNDLVGVLQDMVKDIPTANAGLPAHVIPLPTEESAVVTPALESSEPETGENVVVSLPVSHGEHVEIPVSHGEHVEIPVSHGEHVEIPVFHGEHVEIPERVDLASTTAVGEGTTELVVLHSKETTTEKPLVSISLLLEKPATKKKSETFDQLTNGALSNLVQSLENVKKLNGILGTFANKTEEQPGTDEKAQKQARAEDILDVIKKLIETLKNTPAYVKEDRNLYKYVQTAEAYIEEALELTEQAQKKFHQESPSTLPPPQETDVSLEPVTEPLPASTVTGQETEIALEPVAELMPAPSVTAPETEISLEPVAELMPAPIVTAPETEISREPIAELLPAPTVTAPEISLGPVTEPLPAPTVIVHSVSLPPEPLARKAENVQVEMGKLKAFINLLYGFSPHLTAYTQNTAHKKVAEDIVERALAVLHAIKSVFCGSEEEQSKQALQQLLKEDVELMSQAMEAKRAA
uniref:Uncharacterized protein n=1 Tax=Sphaerodactylus townsendi TaxID=933632 RepID=A0ACB8E5A3_9SAUR